MVLRIAHMLGLSPAAKKEKAKKVKKAKKAALRIPAKKKPVKKVKQLMAYGKPGSGKRKSSKKKPVQKTVNKDGSITFIKKSSVRRKGVNAGSTQGPRKLVKTKVTVAQMKPRKRKTLYVAAPKKNRKQS